MSNPVCLKRKIIRSYCIIPKKVKGTKYWFKKVYILKERIRRFYGYYPDKYFTESWENSNICTKEEYIRYKKTGYFPMDKTKY